MTPNVRYLPAAIADADAVLVRVDQAVTWTRSMRARATASFGEPYNYSGQSYPAVPMPAVIAEIAAVASRAAGHPFDNCLCNLYDGGENTMGFHRDSYEGLVADSAIAIVSLGAARRLEFRDNDKQVAGEYVLEHGSLLLMDRTTQEHWEHAVPREAGVGRRISLTFRRFAPRADEAR